jgi:hypothetical protein
MVKVTQGAIIIMWTFTVFLAMFWWYLPETMALTSDIFLIVTVISAVVSFRVSITKKA